MSPRVNITYTVELDELEEETERLMARATAKLKSLTESSEGAVSAAGMLSVNTADRVATMRSELATLDFMLQDIGRLINGYLHYKSAPEENTTKAPVPADPAGIPEELQQKLQEFANAASPS